MALLAVSIKGRISEYPPVDSMTRKPQSEAHALRQSPSPPCQPERRLLVQPPLPNQLIPILNRKTYPQHHQHKAREQRLLLSHLNPELHNMRWISARWTKEPSPQYADPSAPRTLAWCYSPRRARMGWGRPFPQWSHLRGQLRPRASYLIKFFSDQLRLLENTIDTRPVRIPSRTQATKELGRRTQTHVWKWFYCPSGRGWTLSRSLQQWSTAKQSIPTIRQEWSLV